MFNPAWFRQFADSARELFLDEEHGERLRQVFTPTSARSCFSVRAPVLVIWASQTGAAEAFADEAVAHLRTNGLTARDIPFDTLELSTLESAEQVLFIVSTTCDGDPPDMAEEFCDTVMQQPVDLSQLHYGLLALGDRCYEDFCGFGHQLNDWLQASHARAWFEPVEVDDESQAALDSWRQRIAALLPARQRDTVSGDSTVD